MWEGRPLEIVSEFKYLGTIFHDTGSMVHAATRMHQPFAAAMAKVRTLVRKEALTDFPLATLWLFQVMALSAGLYECQVWATPFLHPT